MKRVRELEKKTEIMSAIEELSLIVKLNFKVTNNTNLSSPAPACVLANTNTTNTTTTATTTDDHDHLQQHLVVSNIPTKPFISLCTFILQVLDKIGPTLAVLRHDIYNNIQRVEMLCESDPARYSNLLEILEKEAIERKAKKGDTCSKALLWLTRSLDFTAALLQNLVIDPTESMEQIVGKAYEMTLKPWHGWISAAAYKVALKLVPDTNTFVCLLMTKGQNVDNLKDEVQVSLSLLLPLLQDLHSILSLYGLERLKST